ncbi:helix-turn-helix transcriptional regulator [Eggerthella sp. YY7918]|uniref:helix-turn-helix transcriptional regulator n=1 Tax=Eggerthella sp. (strain YY7918) TaxID=502558 RepID=UPI0002171000|nr:helix-turn-helix transcriptional regulator [Eggerthella sp. YY7918]BAK43369.1 hypothetical protein EGYY_01030 [Eggerthella sp. YY7918]
MQKRVGRKGSITDLVESAKQYPFLCLGFALYWIWFIVTIQGPIRFPYQIILDFPMPSWCPMLVIGALSFFALSCWHDRFQAMGKRTTYQKISCGIMFGGLFLSTIWVAVPLSYPTEIVVYTAGFVLMGIGASAVLVEFFRYYEKLGATTILLHGVLAMLAATCYQFVFAYFNFADLNMFINPWFPVLIYVCFRKTAPKLDHKLPFEQQSDSDSLVSSKLLITAFVQGLAFGIGLGILLYWEHEFAQPRIIGSLCAGAASVLLFFTALKFKADFTHMIYLVGFPLMALGFLLMACSDHLLALGNAVQAIGSCYQYIVIISLFVYLAKVCGLPVSLVSGRGMACLYIGQVFGGCLGSALASFAPTTLSFSAIASVMCALLLVSSLYISNSGRIEQGWEGVRPAAIDSDVDSLEERARRVAMEVGLTPREADILLLAAQGRNRQYIGAKLCISTETVKTHMRNIYQKTGVHSLQEIIDLVQEKQL